jgi:xanthine/CO dehydrogenase XdhC/CoxF family maturation factor
MSDPLTLTVPADTRYRVLGPEIAAKYVELVGGTAADGQALADAVAQALTDLAAQGGPDAHVDLTLRGHPASIEVTVCCGSHTLVVTRPLPAPQR